MKRAYLIPLSVLLLQSAACSNDRGGGPGAPVGASERIVATEGGMVAITGRDVSIAIPARALASDTDVSITIGDLTGYPELRNAIDEVLEILPEGLPLTTAASVTWRPTGVSLTGREMVRAAQLVLDGETGGHVWRLFEGEVEIGSGGTVSVPLMRLGTLALIVTETIDPPLLTGTVSGGIRHLYTEEPIAAIRVDLINSSESSVANTVSDAEGQFRFAEVPVGSYTVTIDVAPSNNCYGDPTEHAVTVAANATANATFAFVPGPCHD